LQRGFYTLIAAQFLSALADNALLLLVISLLQMQQQAAFWIPLIKVMFTLSYVISGPWVGAWSDNQPKHKVMMQANGIKIVACMALLTGLDPIISFAITGLGAAIYAPAKYGLVTELVSSDQLVHANAWIEVSAVCAALIGFMLGGSLVADLWLHSDAYQYLDKLLPFNQLLSLSIFIVLILYSISALINLLIPDSGKRYEPSNWNLKNVWQSFREDQRKLWSDPLGSISLTVTCLFWGVGAIMQLLVLVWAQSMLDLNLTQSAYLQACSAIGVVIGATLAARYVAINHAPNVLIAGIGLGVLLPLMTIVSDWYLAVLLTIGLGVLGGFFVVPMNALLQARGVKLLSAGRSISVQNSCENSSVLLMLCGYSLLVFLNIPVEGLIWSLSILIVTGMGLTTWRHLRISNSIFIRR
jgi:hypothetical protein